METKSKFFWVSTLAAALLVLNICLLVYIWRGKYPSAAGPSAPQTAKVYLAEALQLSDDQARRFDSLHRSHLSWMRALSTKIDSAKEDLYEALAKHRLHSNPAVRDSLFALAAERQSRTRSHFSQLRSLLNEKQQRMLDSILTDAISIVGITDTRESIFGFNSK